jgi:hypothetical protein
MGVVLNTLREENEKFRGKCRAETVSFVKIGFHCGYKPSYVPATTAHDSDASFISKSTDDMSRADRHVEHNIYYYLHFVFDAGLTQATLSRPIISWVFAFGGVSCSGRLCNTYRLHSKIVSPNS